jgi:hypothetical protein
MSKKKGTFSYGVSFGPMIRALNKSMRSSKHRTIISRRVSLEDDDPPRRSIVNSFRTTCCCCLGVRGGGGLLFHLVRVVVRYISR